MAKSKKKKKKTTYNEQDYTTKAPTGLDIKRDKYYFTFSWKIADKDYSFGITLEWRIQYSLSRDEVKSWSSWIPEYGLSPKATKFVLKDIEKATLGKPRIYPAGWIMIHAIEFRVRGCRGPFHTKKTKGNVTTETFYFPEDSAWSKKKFNLYPPNAPSLSAELTERNVTKFTWSTSTSNEDHRPFTSTQYQTALVRDYNLSDPSKHRVWIEQPESLFWRDVNVDAANKALPIKEETNFTVSTDHSYTRIFRVRARGMGGYSAWKYAMHTYGIPWKAKNVKTSIDKKTIGYQVLVKWESPAAVKRPIDITTVQYQICPPQATNLNLPSADNWTDGPTNKDTAKSDMARISIDQFLEDNQCIFVRVNNKHDNNETLGEPIKVPNTGTLIKPVFTGFDVDPQDAKRIYVKANNIAAETFSTAVVQVYLIDPKTNKDVYVGTIPNSVYSDRLLVDLSRFVSSTVTTSDITFKIRSYVNDGKKHTWYSAFVTEHGTAPSPPKNVKVNVLDASTGTIEVIWDWTWKEATGAELSWADDPNAWISTNQPSTYQIERLNQPRWIINGLELGKKWYVRIRLFKEDGDVKTYGAWSNLDSRDLPEDTSADLASQPAVPILTLSDGVITKDGSTVASWSYSTEDNHIQNLAEIALTTYNSDGTVAHGTVIAHEATAQHTTIKANNAQANFTVGNTYDFAVRVRSSSGKYSEWSDPVSLTIAEPISVGIGATSLVSDVIDGNEVLTLTEMPLVVKVMTGSSNITTSLAIERAESYVMARPDENDFNGFEGETIALMSGTDSRFVIDQDSLIGYLDDGAKYRIVAMIQDELGQTATDSLEFTVQWAHQALMPSAVVEIEPTEMYAIITPMAPEGYRAGDVCDIYRLSADKPELIIQNGSFGEKYVDPYPCLTTFGGHRVVYKTSNGDYITEENQIAWFDLREDDGDIIDDFMVIIDFDGQRLEFLYDIDVSSNWQKDFTETKYLGGSIQGDWNPAVSRTMTVNGLVLVERDPESVELARRLAVWPGICHIRTPDGSSFACNIDVSENREARWVRRRATYSLNITRVDPEGLDGVPYNQFFKDSDLYLLDEKGNKIKTDEDKYIVVRMVE